MDEAQKLKNDKSNVHQNVSKVEACHRLLLTGTPVENNPAELLTLLSFVAPRLFTASGKGSRASLSALFSSVGKGDGVACAPKVAKVRQLMPAISRLHLGRTSAVSRLYLVQVQQLMRPFVLRRLKQEVLSALPPKTEEVAAVRMPPAQGAAYSETVARIAAQQRETLERWARRKAADRAELDAGCEEEVDGRDRGWIASAFTDLRKAAQHPLLLLRHYRPLLPRIAHALHCEGAFGDECTSEMVLSELETWSDIQVHPPLQGPLRLAPAPTARRPTAPRRRSTSTARPTRRSARSACRARRCSARPRRRSSPRSSRPSSRRRAAPLRRAPPPRRGRELTPEIVPRL